MTALCTYRIKAGKENEFLGLLRRHWPALRDLGLASSRPSLVFRGVDESGGTFFTEVLSWINPEAPRHAHELPAVMAIWEPMGMCCEERLGRPAMEFPEVELLEIHG